VKNFNKTSPLASEYCDVPHHFSMSDISTFTATDGAFQKSRVFLITAFATSMASTGIALMASVLTAHYTAHADDLPYRAAAHVFANLAAGACAVAFVALGVLLVALRAMIQRLAELAQKTAAA
jgi:hypothetical protein